MRLLLPLLTAGLTLLLAACSGDPVSAKEGARRKIFLVNNRSDPAYLDLQRCNSVADHQIQLALSEGLVAESRASDRVVEPGVAERWEANADNSVWTFYLRKNGRWSDGVPVTQRHEFVVIAVNRRDGKILWQKTVLKKLPHEGGHTTGSLASNSPVTDGEHVFAYFGSHGLYCLDMNGNVKWQKQFGEMLTKHGHGESASPVLYGDMLFVN